MKTLWIAALTAVMLNSARAGVVGPFSGVSLDHITDTPLLTRQKVVGLTGASLAAAGGGMSVDRYDGEEVVATDSGFALELARDVPAGSYLLTVRAAAPDRGSDSLWVAVDGKRLKRPLDVSTGKLGDRSIPVALSDGKHTFSITLREKPGCRIAGVTLAGIACKVPRPAMRGELRLQHPRLLISSAGITALKGRLADPRVQRFYKPSPAPKSTPPTFKAGKRTASGFRTLHRFALSHLLEPRPEKLQGILRWLEAATAYPDCGVDLDAEYFMEGVALCYDWLYDQIPAELRVRVRDTIARQGRLLYEASLAGRSGGGLSFQQNHFWYSNLALALAAAAVQDEVPEASQWLAWAWDRYERIALSFSPDGSFHEGPGYWSFSMPALYLFTDLYEQCTGLRSPAADRGLMGEGEFRFHYLYPGLHETAAMEDSVAGKSAPAVNPFLWEAKRFRSAVPMGIAMRLAREPSGDSWNLLWLDETVPTAATDAVPRARYYSDVETAFARTSWSDGATYVAMVSRPLGGHVWSEVCQRLGLGGTGHNHPEQNHFVLFGRGEILAGDTGYTYSKQTRDHNTILVDGKGQFADGEMWPVPNPGSAHFTHFTTEGDVTIMGGDATSAYPKEVGLMQFHRLLVLAGPDLVVSYDRLAADQPRTFSWLLHHYGTSTRDGNGWRVTRGRALLAVMPLRPGEFAMEEMTYRPQYNHPQRSVAPSEPDVTMLRLKTKPVVQTSILVPLLIGTADVALPAVTDVSNDTCEAIRSDDTVVAFNRGQGRMTIVAPWGENVETEAACVVARRQGKSRQIVQSAPIAR